MLIKKPGAGDPASRAFDPAASRPFDAGSNNRNQPAASDPSSGTSALDSLRDALGGSGLLERGHILQNRYEIEQVLGIGGMSAVYRGRDLRFANVLRYAAVKEMPDNAPDQRTGELRLATFEREASLLATLNNPGIVKIYDFFADNGRVYLILEYIEGSDLESILEQNGGPLAIQDVLRWSIEVCEVLAYLHRHKQQPIVFRDLKPSNIMISSVTQKVMLIDFGIAKIFQSDKRGTMIGTEGYSPPEQYRGMADPRVDIYALGATIHHLLTNSDPRLETPFTFQERMPRDLNPKISPELEMVIMKALEYSADKRWQSAEAMKEALMAVNQEYIQPSAPKPTLPYPSAWPRVAEPAPGQTAQVWQQIPTHNPNLPQTPPSLPQVQEPAAETQLLWTFDAGDEIRSAALVAKGITFFGSYDHNVYALNAKSGDQLWKYTTEAGVCTQPALANDLIIIGSEDHSVYAFDASRGALAWRFRASGPVRSSPKVSGNACYFGSDDQQVYCLDARTGALLWKYNAWGPVRSSPAIGRDTVYIGAHDSNLYALDAASGQAKWKFRCGAPVTSTPFIHEGLVIFGSADQQLYALEPEGGWAVWKFRTNHYVNSSPTVDNGKVYVGTIDGVMYAIDVQSGRQLWKFETNSQIVSSPKVAGDGVYFGVADGTVICLGRNNGELRWRYRAGGPVTASPAIEDGIVYIGSFDHKLYALAV